MGSTPLFQPIRMEVISISKKWVDQQAADWIAARNKDPKFKDWLQEQLLKLYSQEDEKILGGLKDED